jgi:ABC-type uncharacterized transport system auxiliary subunit
MMSKLKVAVVFFFVIAAGCGGPQIKRYYTLANTAPAAAEAGRAPICSRPVVVATTETVAPYEDEKMVFRTDEIEIKYFNYRLWVEPPPDMLSKLISERLERTNIFSGVETYLESASDHLLLSVKLLAIEEIVNGEEHRARLALRFRLRDPKTEAVLWTHEFDTTDEFRGDDAPALCHALGGIYNKEIDAMLPSLSQVVAANESCAR